MSFARLSSLQSVNVELESDIESLKDSMRYSRVMLDRQDERKGP
jgi:hypothetical protein